MFFLTVDNSYIKINYKLHIILLNFGVYSFQVKGKMDTLQKCLQSLKRSKSDNEKLAALMVISKLTQSANKNVNINVNITKELANELYGAVSNKFILRLLKNTQDENSTLFHQLALDVLSVVAKSNAGVITNDEQMMEGLITLLKSTKSVDNEKQNILELLMMLIPRDRKLDSINGIDMIRTGVESLASVTTTTIKEEQSSSSVRNTIETFLALFLTSDSYGEDTLNVLLGYSEILVNNQDMEKFNELTKISLYMRLLQKLDYKSGKLCDENGKLNKRKILKNIHSAASDLLKSRIKVEYKRLVISMLSSTIQVFGIDWIFDVRGEDASKFCVLTLVSVSVELTWLLNQESPKEGITEQRDFIINCFELTKSFLVCLCSDKFEDNPLSTNSSFIVNMFNSFKNIVASIYSYLQTFIAGDDDTEDKGAGCLDDPIVIEAISVVCVWATEETESLQDELKSVIPLMMKMAKEKAIESKNSIIFLIYQLCNILY